MIDLEGRVSPVYEGSGTTGPFSFAFKVWKTDQITVVVKESEEAAPRLLGPSEFTVSLGEDKGGTVTLNTPLATGGKLVILSDIPYLQSVALENMGLFNPEDLEKAWDTNTALIQQLKEKLDRAVLAPIFGETPEEFTESLFTARDEAVDAKGAAETAQSKAEAAQVAAQAAQSAAESAASDAADSADEAAATLASVGEGVAEQLASISSAGAAQITAIGQAGDTELSKIDSAGATVVSGIGTTGQAVIASVEEAGENVTATQKTAIEQAGAAQVQAVKAEGTTQVSAVSAKGAEVLSDVAASTAAAANSASAAATSAQEAKDAEDAAKAAQTAAKTSQDAAAASQSAAKASETNAASSASDAADAASYAGSAATAAAQSAQNAASSASASAQSAQNAENSATSIGNAEQNAAASASAAAQSASAAATAQAAAEQAAKDAQDAAGSVGDPIGREEVERDFLKKTAAQTSYAAKSHTHTTANIDGLDDALAGKAETGHTHELTTSGDATGTATLGQTGATMKLTLANSGVTASSYGPTANATLEFGGTFVIPYITVDAKGRVTVAANRAMTMPNEITWDSIESKPSTFAPSTHNHAIADVTGLQDALDGKQPAGSYAAATHNHTAAQITDLNSTLAPYMKTEDAEATFATQTALTQGLEGKSDTGHTHSTADVDGLDEALAAKVATSGNQTIAGVKTFSASPVVPTPTADGDAVNKAYADSLQDDTAASILAAFQQFNSENGIE